jgi:hypothetical protein
MALNRIFLVLLATLACSLAAPAGALAIGGNYVIAGGTPYQQQQVRQALAISSFDWSVVPVQITITIGATQTSEAYPGEIRLSGSLLSSGRFSWGVVQHEYAHQVDFFLLSDTTRTALTSLLGARDWCFEGTEAGRLRHDEHGCERFASTLAWSYWPVPENCMRPTAASDESAAMAPAAFRALMAGLLGKPQPLLRVGRR